MVITLKVHVFCLLLLMYENCFKCRKKKILFNTYTYLQSEKRQLLSVIYNTILYKENVLEIKRNSAVQMHAQHSSCFDVICFK